MRSVLLALLISASVYGSLNFLTPSKVARCRDTDATAFFSAASITDGVQKTATCRLVVSLKASGLWSHMVAIYPLVGGSGAQHSYNLKNPAAYQITWHGGVTHNSNGVTGNNSDGYGDTGLVPDSALSPTDAHLSLYSRTNNSTDGYDIGCNNSYILICNYQGAGISYGDINGFESGEAMGSVSDSKGFYLITSSGSATTLYKNGTSIATSVIGSAGAPVSLYILADHRGSPAEFSSKNLAFASVGTGLSGGDATAMNSIITAFETALNRQN